MLAVTSYPQDYIDHCRTLIDAQLQAYGQLAERPQPFETLFCNNMVLVLELSFVHRLRKNEGKDGNPLNEVRLLASSILEHGGVLVADKQIKLTPDTSVLGLSPGDRIELEFDGVKRLAAAFFDELERRCATPA